MFMEIFVLVFIQNYSSELIYPNFRGTIYPNLRRTAPLPVIKYSRSDATAALCTSDELCESKILFLLPLFLMKFSACGKCKFKMATIETIHLV